MERATIAIEGMSCGHCVKAVTSALQGLGNVDVEQVSIGSATVSYDPEVTSADRIAQAIRDAGYEPTVGAAR
ncbi:MAG TPA: cation transporter [Gemmatimonadaceae bacterium]